jgi:hypothetical protein
MILLQGLCHRVGTKEVNLTVITGMGLVKICVSWKEKRTLETYMTT